MLTWYKDINGYTNRWLGGYIAFDDDCPLYRVGKDAEGWYYVYLPDGDGNGGFTTAEEAMAAAESDNCMSQRYADLPPYDGELELLTLAEEAWEERKEEGLW